MKKLVVPLDGSEFAEAALPWAIRLAKAHDLTVTLVRVVPTHRYSTPIGPDTERQHTGPVWKAAATYLGTVKRRLEAEGVEIATEVREGLVGTKIADVAEGADTFAIVMATHGRSGVGRFVLGSFASEVTRESDAPILLVPGEAEQTARAPFLSRIVVPLDGSRLAEAAIPFARSLATNGAEIVLVQVVAPVEVTRNGGGFIERVVDEASTQRRESDAGAYLEGIATSLRQSRVHATHRVIRGRASERILDTTRAASADLVVMTSHGYTGFRRWHLGSVADEIIRERAVPVFLVTRQAIRSVSQPQPIVREFMSEDMPILRADDALSAAIGRMVRWRGAATPVVDGNGILIGVVATRDLLERLVRTRGDTASLAEGNRPAMETVIAEVLPNDCTTIGETASLSDAAQVLIDQHLESIVVTKDDRPIGVLTVQDALSGLGHTRKPAQIGGHDYVV
jgi:nucleotide-binding universal stress UspA family protein